METCIGLFSTVNGGCRLRFTINKFPYQIYSWKYDRYDRNLPILNNFENIAASDDLQSSVGIFSFFNFLVYPESDHYSYINHFYVYLCSNSSLVTNSI